MYVYMVKYSSNAKAYLQWQINLPVDCLLINRKLTTCFTLWLTISNLPHKTIQFFFLFFSLPKVMLASESNNINCILVKKKRKHPSKLILRSNHINNSLCTFPDLKNTQPFIHTCTYLGLYCSPDGVILCILICNLSFSFGDLLGHLSKSIHIDLPHSFNWLQ